ncbi:barstar family protein [Agromyces sp. NPDC057679]|uniref:barstar family protein n=1 Tax=Agromyces sp. NPDC057679 TaxID=3346207 RepID=UPI00366AE0C6
MAVWQVIEEGLDWQLVQDGFVAGLSTQNLESTVEWLSNRGYHVVRFDASRWYERESMHRAFASALDFPAYYGANMDALADCLGDVAEMAYGWPSEAIGLVLVLDGVDVDADGLELGTIRAVLKLISDAARHGSLMGNRILCIVHSEKDSTQNALAAGGLVSWKF